MKVDADAAKCVADIDATQINFKDFTQEVESKNITLAVQSLSTGLSALSSSIADCGVVQLTSKLNAVALSVKFAKIEDELSDAAKIIVGASDLASDIKALKTAVESGDESAVANALVTLMNDYTQITGGCKADQKGCLFVDGVIQIIKEVSGDISPCESSLSAIVTEFETAVTAFDNKDYASAVATVGKGLDDVSIALQSEVCGLKKIADLISKLSPKLKAAVIKVESSGAVTIVVGFADVYDNVYDALAALKEKDYKSFGNAISALLRELRASGCSTKACTILEGLMASIQAESGDFDKCMSTVDQSWEDFESGVSIFESGNKLSAAQSFAAGMVQLAQSVSACDVPEVATIAEAMFTKVNNDAAATIIGEIVQVLVTGADITLDLNSAVKDFKGKSWAAFGADLGSLASAMASSRCQSVACEVVEGFLTKAGTALKDLEECQADLKSTIDYFTQAAAAMETGDYDSSVHLLAAGLSSVSTSVAACGLSSEMSYIKHEAQTLGFSNVTSKISTTVQVLVHGVDLYSEIRLAVSQMKSHDYRSAGESLQVVMDSMYKWTGKHVCTGDHCYIVVGILQYMGSMQGSVEECEADFKGAWADFKVAASNFSDSHESKILHWSHDKKAIQMGVRALGDGMHLVSKGVGDCHLQEFSSLLESLAVRLGLLPEVTWIEELLHILIEGVKVEDEIGSALTCWADENWPGFGYNLAKLLKTLLGA